jgi:hypothetical protein
MQKSDINDRTREYCKNNPLKPDKMFSEKEVASIAKEAYKIGIRGLSILDFEKWFNEIKK